MPRRPISFASPFWSVPGSSSRRSVWPVGAVSKTMQLNSSARTYMYTRQTPVSLSVAGRSLAGLHLLEHLCEADRLVCKRPASGLHALF